MVWYTVVGGGGGWRGESADFRVTARILKKDRLRENISINKNRSYKFPKFLFLFSF